MLPRGGRAPVLVASAAVALVALGHRTALFLTRRADLDALIAANPGWYTYQQLPVEMLRDHLARSLLYLQQVPPVSNLIMGVVVKLASWPVAATYALIALHTLVSILTALVLVHLLSRLYPGRLLLWIAVGLVFVLNADLVVLEYNSLGQTLYEALTMFLVIVVVDLLVVVHVTGHLGHASAAGVATGLLVLTRASWGLFPLVGLILVALLAPHRKTWAVLAYLLPVLVLQGGWTAKNWAVYGIVSPMASTMGGVHAGAGMNNAGLGAEFGRFIQERVTPANGYLDWQVALARGEPGALDRILERTREQDREIERAMGFPNTWFNTVSLRVLSEFGQRVFVEFVVRHPDVMCTKWRRGYGVFWRPIASYGRMFVALFAGGGAGASGLDVPGVVRQLLAGTLPGTHDVKSGTCAALPTRVAPCRATPGSMYTLRWLEPVLLMANVVGVHLLLPLVAVGWLARRLRHVDRDDPPLARLRLVALLVVAATYGYCAVLVNLVETSENMRYRLEVEPVIWLITLISATELARFVRAARDSRRAARTAAGHPAACAA